MNILLINTYSHGGAGVAARRLQAALQSSGTHTYLLTAAEAGPRWPFYAERLSFLPFERDKSVRFSFSLANFGHDLSKHPLVKKADVLHLHWINQGLLSIKNIQQLGALGKPIVWTLHDMWAFTGGCHYSGDCDHYLTGCGNCPYLRHPGPSDLSKRILKRKQNRFPGQIQFITCSEWLAGVARSSALLQSYPVAAIPNPIDTGVFKPLQASDSSLFREKVGIKAGAQVVLFVAMKVSEERKGFKYLQEALKLIKQEHPERPIEILVMGKSEPEALGGLPYPVHALGMLSSVDDLVKAYGAADVFVIPSLEDNLPNTVMESLACGTPVAGFQTGGIPEMVGHLHEGYIAPQRDAAGLAKGIIQVLDNLDFMKNNARQKVLATFTNDRIAARYNALYKKLIGL
jgi:glycosyltransferase involved in cell wall biosynthesis